MSPYKRTGVGPKYAWLGFRHQWVTLLVFSAKIVIKYRLIGLDTKILSWNHPVQRVGNQIIFKIFKAQKLPWKQL